MHLAPGHHHHIEVNQQANMWLIHWRQNDLNTVSSPEFRQFLKDQHFILVTWGDLGRSIPPSAKW